MTAMGRRRGGSDMVPPGRVVERKKGRLHASRSVREPTRWRPRHRWTSDRGRMGCHTSVTSPPACRSSAARRSVSWVATSGSRRPLDRRTGVPGSDGNDRGTMGTIARNRTAPAKRPGSEKEQARGDVRAVRESDGDHAIRIEAVVRRGRGRRNRRARGPALQDPRDRRRLRRDAGRTAACRARAPCRAGSACPPRAQAIAERQQIVLVAAGSVQQQQRRRGRRVGRRCVHVNEAEAQRVTGCGAATASVRSAGSACLDLRALRLRGTAAARASRRGARGSSSIAKPGPSVASSNSTPPGSLKYTDLNQKRSITGVACAPALSTCCPHRPADARRRRRATPDGARCRRPTRRAALAASRERRRRRPRS